MTTTTTTTTDDDDAATQLVQQWETILSSANASGGKDGGSGNTANVNVVPSTVQMYKLGTILHALDRKHAASPAVTNVRQGYHLLLDALPLKHRRAIFEELHQGVQLLIQEKYKSDSAGQSSIHNIQSALESLAGLYRSSPLPAESTDQPLETMASLASFYSKIDKNTKGNKNANANERQQLTQQQHLQSLILSLLSQFLWAKTTVDWEQLLAVIDRIQQEDNMQVWKDLTEWETERDSDWIVKIASRYPEETQYDYLFNMLSSEQTDTETGSYKDKDSVLPQEKQAPKPTVQKDEIQRRIDQVRQVLPDLGEGFVETALSYYKGNVEQTVQVLLDDPGRAWPASLQTMDRTLPRRHRNVTTAKEEEEAKLAAKATLRAVVRQQREEAAAVDVVLRTSPATEKDEYNDDYDDQYDDTEGFGNADSGLYDDYETVRTYNRVLQGVEQEQSFWEESRNTNRSGGDAPKKNQGGGEKDYRGPDKGRGGRVPYAERGGGGDAGRGGGPARGGGSGPGRAPGRGRGKGRGGGGAGAGPAASKTDGDGNANGSAAKKGDADNADSKATDRPNPKQKARQLANRRDQQKRAQTKRSG
jgi:hypothetical protein